MELKPLKLDRNPYKEEDREYFETRRQKRIDAKFRKAVYKLYQHRCPLCQQSLYNEELVELHHIIPQKAGGKYSLGNIAPLHQICHQQITHGNNTLERLKIEIPQGKKRKVRGRKDG